MGGPGSGRRWYRTEKDTPESFRKLDVRRMRRDGLLVPGTELTWYWDRQTKNAAAIEILVGHNNVSLSYRARRVNEKEWREQNQLIELVWTECQLGGARPWFVCPQNGCPRRVAILYGGGDFACRHCRGLAYISQRQDECDRLATKVNKIRQGLGWTQGVLNTPVRSKPKGMHWKTYRAITAEHDRLLDKSLHSILAKIAFKKSIWND